MPSPCSLHPVTDQVIATIVGPFEPGLASDARTGPVGRIALDTPPSIHEVLANRLARSAGGDRRALDPCPEVDGVLHRLVRLLVSPAAEMGGHTSDDGPVAIEVAERLDRDDLRPRARTIRRAACLAETRMEHHYAAVLEDSWSRAGEPDPADRASDAVGRLCRLLRPFPYVGNYLHLVDAEIRALRATGRPIGSVAVCGAGPLPLTGLLLHVLLGCPVTLIDHDPEAVRRSSALVRLLEGLGIVAHGAVVVSPTAAERTSLGGHDVVLVAALVPQPALNTVVSRLVDRPGGAPRLTLLARSARGLVARLAYRPFDRDEITGRGVSHLGTVLPDNAGGTTAPESDAEAALAVAHHEVLNCTEVFALR